MNYRFISKIYLALAWAGAVFVAIGTPMPMPKLDEGPTYYDKGIHVMLFGILCFLVIRALRETRMPLKRIYHITFLLTWAYAFAGEYYQLYVPNRNSDLFDLVFGTIGILSAIGYDHLIHYKPKPKLLLHICCIGCGAYVSELLRQDYRLTLFFYNPNIFPRAEYDKRLEEIGKVARLFKSKVLEGDYDHEKWRAMVRGREADPEKGERCRICYRDRLEATAKIAREKGFGYFTSTLTISPHKDAKAINEIGNELSRKYLVKFLEKDFKKKDGFKLSVKLSKELGLYRQDYCGCEFSMAYSKCENCDLAKATE